MTDHQSYKYQLTINNPADKSLDHETLKQILGQLKSCVYWCMADEIGLDNHTPHTHIFTAMKSPVRFSTIKRRFPEAHIEPARGTAQENRAYVQKSGKWEHNPKADTSVPDTFEEWGELPEEMGQGARTDIAEIYRQIDEGLSNAEIMAAKVKKRIENPEENRAIFLNVHEAIIDRTTWEKVQSITKGTRRKRPTVSQEPSAFSGFLKCPECGGNLNFHFNQGNHDIKFFSCQNHNSGLRKCSKTHYIRLDFLEQVVLYEINRLASFANEYEDDFIKAMMGRSAKVTENERARKQRELDGLLARDKELDMLFERLYEDNVSGKIDDARFSKMSKRYEQEQGENGKRIKALRLELKKSEGRQMDIDMFLATVRRYTNATEITQRMVAELIDHIDVYHAEKKDGVTTQHIAIFYNCIGAFTVPDRQRIPEAEITMGTRKGVAVSYSPERIAV